MPTHVVNGRGGGLLFWRAERRGETKNRAWYRLFAHALENIMHLIIKLSRDATDIIINIFINNDILAIEQRKRTIACL